MAEGLVDWVRSHVPYNSMLEPGKIAAQKGISAKEESALRSQFWTPKTLLQKQELCAVCAGFSRLVYQMAKNVGVPLYNVQGFTRGALQVNGTYTKNPVNHSWNILVLDLADGKQLLIPSDPTQSRVTLPEARRAGFEWTSPYSFPDTVEHAAFFHYSQYFTKVEDYQQKVDRFQPLALPELQWREWGSIKTLDRFRNQVLQPTRAATIDRMPEFD